MYNIIIAVDSLTLYYYCTYFLIYATYNTDKYTIRLKIIIYLFI